LIDGLITVLNTIVIYVPLVRVERAVKVCSVARWKKTAEPNVEFGRYMELADRVQYLHIISRTAIVGVEHHADILRDIPAEIQTPVVEKELVEIFAGIGFRMLVAGLYSAPNSERGVKGARLGPEWRRGEYQKHRQPSGGTFSKHKNTYGTNTTVKH
jgi:hypothetical protein